MFNSTDHINSKQFFLLHTWCFITKENEPTKKKLETHKIFSHTNLLFRLMEALWVHDAAPSGGILW